MLIWQSGKRYRLYADSPIDAVILNFDFTMGQSDVPYMSPVGDGEYCEAGMLEKPNFSDCPQLSEPLCLPNMREVEADLTRLVCEFRERKRFFGAAARMLLATDEPILNIAERCGFASASHFSNVFRSFVHESPMEYRKNRRLL